MEQLTKMRWTMAANVCGRLLLATGLLVFGLGKIFAVFDGNGHRSSVGPAWLMAAALAEVLSGTAILMRVRHAATLACVVSSVLAIGLAVMAISRLDLSKCGCFGSVHVSPWSHAVVAAGLVVLAFVVRKTGRTLGV
jgi:hypothetical protein